MSVAASRSLIVILAVSLWACRNPLDFGGCDTYASPALRLSVIDARTGATLPGLEGARAIARDGAFADTALLVNATTGGIAYERHATCWQPHLKGFVLHQNSIYNNWRFENVWLEK